MTARYAAKTEVDSARTRDEIERTTPESSDPLDEAVHTVWLEGNWHWVTRKMTTEAREAAVAAVLRHNQWINRDEPDEDTLTRAILAWWDS